MNKKNSSSINKKEIKLNNMMTEIVKGYDHYNSLLKNLKILTIIIIRNFGTTKSK